MQRQDCTHQNNIFPFFESGNKLRYSVLTFSWKLSHIHSHHLWEAGVSVLTSNTSNSHASSHEPQSFMYCLPTICLALPPIQDRDCKKHVPRWVVPKLEDAANLCLLSQGPSGWRHFYPLRSCFKILSLTQSILQSICHWQWDASKDVISRMIGLCVLKASINTRREKCQAGSWCWVFKSRHQYLVVTCLPLSIAGAVPLWMWCARPSTMAVLPTPTSPMRQGLVFVCLLRHSASWSISFLRP